MRNLAEIIYFTLGNLKLGNDFVIYANSCINLVYWPAAAINHWPTCSIQMTTKFRITLNKIRLKLKLEIFGMKVDCVHKIKSL